MSDDLLADLETAELANYNVRDCPACTALAKIEDPQTKMVLTRAMAGTIGSGKLSVLLKQHGIIVSDRQIRNHRSESETAQ